MSMTQRQLADTVVIDPGIKPEDIRDCLVDNVNLAWRAGGNNGFCHITANFVGWMLQENDRLTRDLAQARAEVASLTTYRDGLDKNVTELEAQNERLRAALAEIKGWKHDTLGPRPQEPDECNGPQVQTAAFDRGARMAFYRCADRAQRALEQSAAKNNPEQGSMKIETDDRMLGFLAQIFDEQVDGQMTGYDAARQIVRCLDADGYQIAPKGGHVPEIPE
jgi:hypothetical protein